MIRIPKVKTAVMGNFKYILISSLLTLSMNCAAQRANSVTTTKPYGGVSYAAMFNGDLDCRNSIVAGLTWRSGC